MGGAHRFFGNILFFRERFPIFSGFTKKFCNFTLDFLPDFS